MLLAGCVAVLVFQVAVFPRNTNLNDYRFPTDVTATSAALVPRYPGTMLQVANNGAVVHSPDPAALSSEVMFGNMLQAVGVQAVTSYYGMGFKAFTDSLCIEFNGSVCPDALRRAFEPPHPAHRRWPTCCGWRPSSSRTICPGSRTSRCPTAGASPSAAPR